MTRCMVLAFTPTPIQRTSCHLYVIGLLVGLQTDRLSQTYSWTYPGCDKVFMKPFELKKHKATHETPDQYV